MTLFNTYVVHIIVKLRNNCTRHPNSSVWLIHDCKSPAAAPQFRTELVASYALVMLPLHDSPISATNKSGAHPANPFATAAMVAMVVGMAGLGKDVA
jgi:hypothetical protein